MRDIKIDMFAMECPVSVGTADGAQNEIMIGATETPWGMSVVVGVNVRGDCTSAALSPDKARTIAQMMRAYADKIDGGGAAKAGETVQ